MSTLKVSNIQNADAAAPSIVLHPDGTVDIPSLILNELDELNDVSIDNPAQADLLVYDASESTWKNTGLGLPIDAFFLMGA